MVLRAQLLLAVLAAVAWRPGHGDGSCSSRGGASCSPSATRASAFSTAAAAPSGDVLLQEVEGLQEIIKLSEERIRIIKELETGATSGRGVRLTEAQAQLFREKIPLISEAAVNSEFAPLAKAEDFLLTKLILPLDEVASFVDFLILRTGRPPPNTLPTVPILPTGILATAQTDGVIRIFSFSGDMLLSFPSGHKEPLVRFLASPYAEDTLLVTADDSGVIRLHKILAKLRKLSSTPRIQQKQLDTERASQYLGPSLNVTTQMQKQMKLNLGKGEHVPRITALALAASGGQKYVIVGDDEGRLSVFSRNGTLQSQTALPVPGAVEGLAVSLATVIFWGGSEWGFYEVDRKRVRGSGCPALENRIVDAKLDGSSNWRYLVADELGQVWVFTSKTRRTGAHSGPGSDGCRLEHKFPALAMRPGPGFELGPLRGFVLALDRTGGVEGAPTALMALNLSEAGAKRKPNDPPFQPIVWRRARAAVRDWAHHRRFQQGDVLALLSEDGKELEIVEVLMQAYVPPTEESFSNFKLPVIAVAVVMVLGYQFFKQKGKLPAGARGRGGGAEMMQALKAKRQLSAMKAGGRRF